MAFRKLILSYLAIAHFGLLAAAQEQPGAKPAVALEARLTTYLQSGYDLAVFYYPQRSKFSFGALFAGHNITGNTKEWLFTSNDHDALDIRLTWIASLLTRYHFSSHKEGFFAELGIGMEEFRVSSGNEEIRNTNGFIAPSVGYIWYPWQRTGFYVLPKITGVLTLFREEEQVIHAATTYQLRPVFATPSFAIGWKF